MRKQLGVILLATLFLFSVPMVANASSLMIHEEPIYTNSVTKNDESLGRVIEGEDVDLSFLSESNTVLNEEQYLEKWNKHNPDYKASKLKIVGENVGIESDSVSPFVVIGPDGRNKVSNINITPYEQTVYLESLYINIFSEVVVYRCSGSFFRDNLAQGKVLTAAHCIHKNEMDDNFVQGYVAGMAVYKGMKNGEYDDVSYASSVKIPTEYVNDGGIINDIGVVTMQDNLSAGAGTLDLENASSRTVRIGGYPAEVRDVRPIYDQYQMSGSATLSSGILSYTIDTSGGQSGTPILDNNTNKVIGVHSAGSKVNQRNYAAALNPIKILFIKQ